LTLKLLKYATFSGSFMLPSLDLSGFHISSSITEILGEKGLSKPEEADVKEWTKFCDTILVVTLLKGKCADQEDIWELVVSKAEGWIAERAEEWEYNEKTLERIWSLVKRVVDGEEEGLDGIL